MASKQPGNSNPTPVEPPDLKRKLAWRMGFAGMMIVMLLGTLAVFDYLSAPDETELSPPRFTEPVPVPKKEITQPVKPAEPLPEPASEVKKAEPEVSTAPVEAPARPEVAAQPVQSVAPGQTRMPHPAEPRAMPLSRPQPQPSVQQQAPAASHAIQPRQAETRPAGEVEPLPQVVRQQVAPAPAGGSTLGGRLFSGFALQAGVFSDPRLAEELHAKLTLNGIPSTIEARVQVGPFKTREEADAAREKMKSLGIDAVLLAPPKGAVRH